MAALFDTHQSSTGKAGVAATAMTRALAVLAVNDRILSALAGSSAP